MAAPEGNQNGLGNSGGKSLQDRKLAAEVRRMTLNKIKALFELPRVDMSDHDAQLHDRILEKLAGTVLPRLTEVTGEDGGALLFTLTAEDKAKLDTILDGKPAKPTTEQASPRQDGGGEPG
jgi:hypothetical protein